LRLLRLPGLWRALACCACFTSAVAAAQTQAPPAKPLDPDHAAKMAKGLQVFKKHVRPLLEKRCVRCHGGEQVKSDFDLSDRDELLRGGVAGPAVIPGNAKESLLLRLVNHDREPFMPKNGKKLQAEVIAHIAAWIDLGAPYDEPLVARKRKTPGWTERLVSADARKHWSLQPLKRTLPPAVKNGGWCRTAIDRFVLARQEEAGIQPNREADRRHLIRRAYFDLLGLPPPPEEVKAFLADPAADAYEKLIDRLLQSPHYGERWGRYWLDLARFAESHGFEHDYDRPTAYHYRDFVIQALNADLPYDSFIKWQLAGDELAPDDNLAQMATGFLAAGVHSTQITKNEVEKHRYDELDDQLATTGTAMLGLTIGCARCHDHKYDPIPQRDYYRLLSTFTTTVRSEVELNFDKAGYQKARAAFDKEHAPLEAALQRFEAEVLPGRLAAWEKSEIRSPKSEVAPWIILDSVKLTSKEGATFTRQPDDSYLASGKNGKHDSYTVVAHTDLTGIRAVRLEALAHPSLAKGGPGRAANGNFALTDFRLTVAPSPLTPLPTGERSKGEAGGKAVAVRLKNARATFEQKGLPVAAAIDGDEKSAWAVDPQFGKDHAAVFETEGAVGFPGGSVLTITLHFKNNDMHSIGRLRLAVTSRPGPVELTAPGIPQQVMAVLKTPTERRDAGQKATLLKWYGSTIDPEGRRLHQQARDHLRQAPRPALQKVLVATEGLPAIRLHTQGDDFFPQTFFLRRGDPNNKEGIATQGFLQVLMTAPDGDKHWQKPPPAGWRTSNRRRALADWITDVDHGAGKLLARVIVNRMWQHHLGRGIVATPSDFGTRGERPTHPKLLDWLATELIKEGWRLRPIHKLIMTSAVYRQGAQVDEARAKVDRDNKLCWRWSGRRLEAEVIRDSLLAVSGQLDARMFGPGTLDEGSRRRSIYFTVKRSKLVPMMQVFDAPEALSGVADRPTTTIAPQALLLMNNPNVRGHARALARRIAPAAGTSVEEAVKAGFLTALARPPTADELDDSVAFVREQLTTYPAASRRELALADFCQVLMCLNEFIYVD
jgi:hypothetical protein